MKDYIQMFKDNSRSWFNLSDKELVEAWEQVLASKIPTHISQRMYDRYWAHILAASNRLSYKETK